MTFPVQMLPAMKNSKSERSSGVAGGISHMMTQRALKKESDKISTKGLPMAVRRGMAEQGYLQTQALNRSLLDEAQRGGELTPAQLGAVANQGQQAMAGQQRNIDNLTTQVAQANTAIKRNLDIQIAGGKGGALGHFSTAINPSAGTDQEGVADQSADIQQTGQRQGQSAYAGTQANRGVDPSLTTDNFFGGGSSFSLGY